jgi:dihydroneopterin aldolase
VTATDRIIVQRLAIFAKHGAYAEERTLGQRFYISLDCRLDLRKPGMSDRLADTISYADLAALALQVSDSRSFYLLEAFAETVAGEILAVYPAVEEVIVRIDKPSAPVPAVLDNVAVEIRRVRPAKPFQEGHLG